MDNLNRRSFLTLSAIALAELQMGFKWTTGGDACTMVIGKDLPPRYPRRIVPENFDAGSLADVLPLFARMQRARLRTPAEVEEWLFDFSALMSAVAEEEVRRDINRTCHTDNPACEKRYLQFVNRVQPAVTLGTFALLKKYARAPGRSGLPAARYFVLNRTTDNMMRLFRARNIPVQQQDEKLCVDYEKLIGAMTVDFQGAEYTMPQMQKFYDQTDRAVRQAAWEAAVKRRLRDRAALDDLYSRMVRLRVREARNAGFDNYRDYAFLQRERFDYGVKECEQFHAAVEKVVLPLNKKIYERRRQRLGLAGLRPWDLSVDPEGRPPLRPYETVGQLIDGCVRILDRINPEYARTLSFLRDHQLLDLESRKGKAPGGYQTVLMEHRLPFIFMNAAGLHDDVTTLLHETGHSVHTFACREEPIITYRFTGSEFSELASQSMEIMGRDHYDIFYSPEDAARAKTRELESDIDFFGWCSRVDAFQQWIYTHPGHTVAERDAEWISLQQRLSPDVDYTGYEDFQKSSWHRQSHIFTSPFYYIEYGISLLAAHQVRIAVQKDRAAGIAALNRGLALGGSRPLPDLFSACGLKFDFSEEAFKPIVDELAKELGL